MRCVLWPFQVIVRGRAIWRYAFGAGDLTLGGLVAMVRNRRADGWSTRQRRGHCNQTPSPRFATSRPQQV